MIDSSRNADGSPSPRRATQMCQSRLKMLGLALAQYSQDYDEKWPPAKEWVPATVPYITSRGFKNPGSHPEERAAYTCPSLAPSGYGYALNWKLSRKIEYAIESPATTVSLYDSKSCARNAIGIGLDVEPRHALEDGAPGANFLFADGHVKIYRAGHKLNFNLSPR